jgi:peptide/nickel transport system substrate-binding protein
MNTRKSAALLVALGMATVMAACSDVGTQATNSSTTPHRGGNLVFARSADIITFDRTKDFDNELTWTSDLMFETLYKPSRDGRSDVPWLATGYQISPDKLTWTFHLRPGVTFSNGQPLTAADVKFSLDTTRAPGSGWSFIDAAISRVSTPDPETVVITTSKPWAPLLSDVSIFPNGIIPHDYGGMTEARFLQHPIGTGPFTLGRWTKGQQLELLRNPHYWQAGKPYLDSVTFTDVGDDTTRVNQLKGGASAVVEFPPFSAVQSLKATPGVVVDEFPADRVDFLLMNDSRAPLDDVHVRRAIALSLDRQAMVKALLFGNGRPANTYLPPNIAFYDPASGGAAYDPARARAELAQSRYPHGFTITLQVIGGNLVQSETAQIVQQELSPLGITVRIQQQDQNSQVTDVENGSYSLAFQYWTSDVVDADELVSALSLIGVHYSDPAFTTLVNRAASTFDRPTRARLYDQIQELVTTDAPLAELWYQPLMYARSSAVHGFLAAPTGDYELENVWLS